MKPIVNPKTLLSFVGLLLTLTACENETIAPSDLGTHTYTLLLDGSLTPFGDATRAADEWADGSTLYLQFVNGTERTSGRAVFDAANATWTVTTASALAADTEGVCEAYFFDGGTIAGTQVTIGPTAIPYADTVGTYIVDVETNAVLAHAQLTPLTGRIRFTGSAGEDFTVSGFTRYTSFNIATGKFTTTDAKLSGTIGTDGSTDYYYVNFADPGSRKLTFDALGNTCFFRTFPSNVLARGSSGFLSVPTADNAEKWTLANADNGEEITLPTVSPVTTTNIHGHAATLSAVVTSTGNGNLFETGFIYAITRSVTPETGVKIALGKTNPFSTILSGLEILTTYYVCAYATNERGTTWSDVTSFSTTDGYNDTFIGLEGYGEDEDLGDDDTPGGGSGGTIGRNGYGNDEDLAADAPNSATGRNSNHHDENWN